jgi:CubicO group peptidase (beta-lactamase class C family)
MHEIDKLLFEEVEKNRTPSVHYVAFTADEIIHRGLFGFSDIINQQKAQVKTTYHAFSVTKTFTALSILQLTELKNLEIEHPAKEYLPGFPYPPEITVKQLLSHSAGIPNPIPLKWIHLAEEHDSFDRNNFFSEIMARNRKTKFKPNAGYSYSNLGYVLLGQIIEKVSGKSFEEYVRMNILRPLNIKPDEMDFTIAPQFDHAKGYHKKNTFSNFLLGFLIDKSKFMGTPEGPWVPFKESYVNGPSYGGLIGTPDAFVKYVQDLLRPDGRLISDQKKKMLFTENYTENHRATGMCLSWFCGELSDTTYFAHAGGGGGYYCEVRIYPEKGLGSVVMFNRTGMSDQRFLNRLDRFILNSKAGHK